MFPHTHTEFQVSVVSEYMKLKVVGSYEMNENSPSLAVRYSLSAAEQAKFSGTS